jgi:hypothetical protein
VDFDPGRTVSGYHTVCRLRRNSTEPCAKFARNRNLVGVPLASLRAFVIEAAELRAPDLGFLLSPTSPVTIYDGEPAAKLLTGAVA